MIDVTHDLDSDDYAGEAHADRQTMRENRLAIDFALAAAADYDFEQGIMVRSGKINAACSERSLALARRYAAHLRKLGEPCTELDGDDLARITGSPYYTGGVHTPGTVMIQPAAYIKSLALGLWRDGVRVLECTPVLALEYVPGLAARTAAGTIRAGRIILATNGHVRAFGHYRRQLMDITTFASITAPLSADQARALGGEAAWSLTPAAPHGSTVRRVRGALYGGDRLFSAACSRPRG